MNGYLLKILLCGIQHTSSFKSQIRLYFKIRRCGHLAFPFVVTSVLQRIIDCAKHTVLGFRLTKFGD